MLQAFGTELAETELPNDVQSTSSVLLTHTEKKDRAKVCVGDGRGGGEGEGGGMGGGGGEGVGAGGASGKRSPGAPQGGSGLPRT